MKKSKALSLVPSLFSIYMEKHVSRSAAELAYFLTLSVFPLLICLYAMLENLVPNIWAIFDYLDGFIPTEVLETLMDYLSYVSSHNSTAMLTAGIILLATSSAAAFRSLHNIMAELQGVPRFRGFFFLAVSFLVSLVFLAVVYFAVVVMITGNWFLSFVDEKISFISISSAWRWLRFVLLFALLLLIIYGIYRLTAPRNQANLLLPGALVASALLVGVSILFSMFISLSVRYPLVYGSLASIILLMLWLYICGNIIIMGNAFNVVLRDLEQKMP